MKTVSGIVFSILTLSMQAKAQGIATRPAESPASFEGWYKEGMTKARTKDFKSAVAAFTECIRLKPEALKLYQLRAEARLEISDTTGALLDYTKMTELVPANDTVRLLRAGFFVRIKKYEQAVTDYSFVINRNKTIDGCWLGRGSCYLRLNQLDKAIADFTYLITKNAADTKAFMARAEAWCKKGDAEKAWADEYKVYELGGYMTLPCSKWLTQKGPGSNLYKFSKKNETVPGGSFYGFVNAAGKVVVPAVYDNAADFSEGLAKVCRVMDGKKFYGFINADGKEVIPCRYGSAYDFSEGLAMVSDSGTFNAKFGFINTKGVFVIPQVYDVNNTYRGNGFSEGVAMVVKNYKCGGINKKGETVIPFTYAGIARFSEGIATVYEAGPYERHSLLNHKGEKIILALNHALPFSEGLSSAGTEHFTASGLFPGGKTGYIDRTGKTVIPIVYEYAYDFQEGLAAVRKQISPGKTRYGFIDKSGKEMIPFIYKNACSFSEGLAKVTTEDGRSVFIDKKGKEIIPLEGVSEFAWIEFKNGYALIEGWGKPTLLIDKAGKVIAEIK